MGSFICLSVSARGRGPFSALQGSRVSVSLISPLRFQPVFARYRRGGRASFRCDNDVAAPESCMVCWLHLRTDRVVLEHAHGVGCSGAREAVEEAGHGHGQQAHVDDAGLGCLRERGVWSAKSRLRPGAAPSSTSGGWGLGAGGRWSLTFLGHLGLLFSSRTRVPGQCDDGRARGGVPLSFGWCEASRDDFLVELWWWWWW